ncbi:hypothetical protein ACFL0S_04865 [Thermodesulfobacteriota bacterium]
MSLVALCLYGPKVIISKSHRLRKNPSFPWLIIYIAYALFITVLFPLTIPGNDKNLMIGGFFKNEGRIIFQIVFFLITVNLILWPSYIFNSPKQIFTTFKVIFLSVATLAVLGIIQLISLYTSGFDPFPIHRVYGLDNTGGMLYVQGLPGLQRINSLAGEPKHFAIALIIGLLILIIYRLNKRYITQFEIPILAIFFVCLLATYSTTGYLLFTISLACVFILYRHKMTGTSIIVIVLVILSLYAVSYRSGSGSYSYIEKTVNKTGLEVQDLAVFDYFKDNINVALTGTGLGNIHHLAVKYLPNNFPIFRDTPFKANSGFLLLLGDVGFIGILLLLIFIFKLIRRRSKKGALPDWKERNIVTHITLISSSLFLFRYFELFFVFCGLLMYYRNLKLKKQDEERRILS